MIKIDEKRKENAENKQKFPIVILLDNNQILNFFKLIFKK